MKVKIKRLHENAKIPFYASKGDAGMDLTAVSKECDDYGNTVYGTGLAFEIPEGFVGLLFPRSSNAKTDLRLTNSVGVLDSGYRGEVMFKFKSNPDIVKAWNICNSLTSFSASTTYDIGDRIGQIIILPYPTIEFEEVDELSETARGSGGYGSSGK